MLLYRTRRLTWWSRVVGSCATSVELDASTSERCSSTSATCSTTAACCSVRPLSLSNPLPTEVKIKIKIFISPEWIYPIAKQMENNKLTNRHTQTRLTALCPGLPGWAGTRKVKPVWILLKQETWCEWQWHQLGHMQVCSRQKPRQHPNRLFIKFFYKVYTDPISCFYYEVPNGFHDPLY